jgi:hypothetical protein
MTQPTQPNKSSESQGPGASTNRKLLAYSKACFGLKGLKNWPAMVCVAILN